MYKKLTLKYGKSIEIDLAGQVKVYFPALLELAGKNVISIDFMQDITNFSGAEQPTDFSDLFLNLTENGQKYFTLNYPLDRINIKNTRGLKLDINRKINFADCYIYNPTVQTGSITFVVWWSEQATKEQQATLSVFDNVELILKQGNGYNNLFPDYKTFVGYSVKNIILPDVLISPSSVDIVSAITLNAAYLTLQKGTKIVFDQMPLIALQQELMYEHLTFDKLEFDFNNSFIQIAKNLDVSADLNKRILLTFEFEDK
ncbi:MAG: hypothetical protein LBS50_08700 [Prevotellaceae bacterium]|jgi:hypothetical protein|nr:hypothetical protein [Prevotellaceae bacterium]